MDWRAMNLIKKYRALSNEETCPVCLMNYDSKIVVDCFKKDEDKFESEIFDDLDDLLSFIYDFRHEHKCKFFKYTQIKFYDMDAGDDMFEDAIEWDSAQDLRLVLKEAIEVLKKGKVKTMFCFTLVNEMYLDPTLSYGKMWEKIQEDEFEEDEFVEESRDIRIMYLLIQFIIRYPMGYRVPDTKTDAVNYIIEKMPEIDKDIAINLVDRAYTEAMASTFENEQILKETFMSKVELRGNTIQILDYYKHHRSPFMKIKDDIYKASKLSVKNYEYFGTSPESSPQDIEYFENSFQMNIEFRKSVKLTCDHKIHYDCLTNNLKHREGVLIEKNEHDDDTRPIFRDYEQEFYRTLRDIPDDDYLLYPNDNFLTHTIPMKCPTCITDKYFTITPCVYKLNNHVCRDVFISEVKFNPLFPRNDIEIDHITDQFTQ